MRIFISTLLIFVFFLASCSKSTTGTSKAVKPKYHHSWYKDHTYKRKWQVWRIKFQPEKQGVKRLKMKS